MAAQAGDVIRADLVLVRDSAAPPYSVVLLSENRTRLCDKLSVVLNRRFSLGTRSFLLKPHEAAWNFPGSPDPTRSPCDAVRRMSASALNLNHSGFDNAVNTLRRKRPIADLTPSGPMLAVGF
jgi:hypothetical protein